VTYLLDSSVIIDALNDRKGRPQLLAEISQQDILLACCSINVTEVYMAVRSGEKSKTKRLLQSLEFYPVNYEAAQLAGDLFRQWRKKGQPLSDATIAAVALTHHLVLVTDNQKHFPMTDLRILPLPPAT
jgi:predicted nucleic acid-binding protein